MNKTAIAALIAALAAGPALAQTTTGTAEDPNVVLEPEAEAGDAEVIVVDPEVEAVETETVDPEVEVVEDPEVVVTDVEVAATDLMEQADLIRTRDITGGTIYSTGEEYYDEASWTASDPYAATRLGGEPAGVAGTTAAPATGAAYQPYAYDQGYDNIGSIEDVVLDSSGQMVGIVAEVGGFLDIGDKHVMLPVEDVRLVPVDDTEYAYVTRLTADQLMELPNVDEGFWD